MVAYTDPDRFVRTAGNYDTDLVSDETALRCNDPSRTRQDQKDEADINVIAKNFGLYGTLPTNVRVPSFGDFTGVGDYREAVEAIRAADASFMAMDARVRARFENDPQLFIEFCSNEANLDEMRTLGLAVPLPEEPKAP